LEVGHPTEGEEEVRFPGQKEGIEWQPEKIVLRMGGGPSLMGQIRIRKGKAFPGQG